jgi:hypothetical protein
MSDSKLSADLEYWRDQKPSQWKMDEFIHKAKLLEDRIVELEKKPGGENRESPDAPKF